MGPLTVEAIDDDLQAKLSPSSRLDSRSSSFVERFIYVVREGVREAVDCYFSELRAGDDNAFHSLTDDASYSGPLLDAFAAESDPEMRAIILELVCYHRQPGAFVPLCEAVVDKHEVVWKAALDGFVLLANDVSKRRALSGLMGAKAELLSRGCADAVRIEWLEEALEQVRATCHG